ncbi:Helix-turn-helix domain-containing protein [Dyadobacter sp. SG02]|uniref:AraC family transcriptional regulator n=1 Tax=Dyadobacter sp. SG02 TaxID=1855291 RepID=UPI0008D2F927|nr:helix-turn-helix domain-containing protein [Dyadobacter sp. SG02]SEJ59601.1 Helix-turn-helix domain-containing protein [Dyadobacter sp. SG02]
MDYQIFPPHADLRSLVKCYWTLQVPADSSTPKQRILPDGCIELFFILGDDVKRFTSEEDFIIQPREMVLGQITEPYFIQPTGYVNSFAVRFYPYGFAHFVDVPIDSLANTETPVENLFGAEAASHLKSKITGAGDTVQRIQVIEGFLLERMKSKATIDKIVKAAVETLLAAKGSISIHSILKDDLSKRRQLERKFSRQIGVSPKQLGKIIRLQAVLKMLIGRDSQGLTNIAYESDYHDQAHFIKDFREFTGASPKHFLRDSSMALSALLYSRE